MNNCLTKVWCLVTVETRSFPWLFIILWLTLTAKEVTKVFVDSCVQVDKVEAVLANTKQILNQFLHKSGILPEYVCKHCCVENFGWWGWDDKHLEAFSWFPIYVTFSASLASLITSLCCLISYHCIIIILNCDRRSL